MAWYLGAFGFFQLLLSCLLFVILLVGLVSSKSRLGEFLVHTAIDRSDDELKQAIKNDNDNISKIFYYLTPWSFCMTTTRRAFQVTDDMNQSVNLQDYEIATRQCTSHAQVQEVMNSRRESCATFQKGHIFDMSEFYPDDSNVVNNFVLEKIFSIVALVLLFYFCFVALFHFEILQAKFLEFLVPAETSRSLVMTLVLWASIGFLITTIVLTMTGQRKVPERKDNGNANWNQRLEWDGGPGGPSYLGIRPADIVLSGPIAFGPNGPTLPSPAELFMAPTFRLQSLPNYGRQADYFFNTLSEKTAENFKYYPTTKDEKINIDTNFYDYGINPMVTYPTDYPLTTQDSDGNSYTQSPLKYYLETYTLRNGKLMGNLCNFNEDFMVYYNFKNQQYPPLDSFNCDLGTCTYSHLLTLETNQAEFVAIMDSLFEKKEIFDDLSNDVDKLFDADDLDPICSPELAAYPETQLSQTFKCLQEHTSFVDSKPGFGWYMLTILTSLLVVLSAIQTILTVIN